MKLEITPEVGLIDDDVRVAVHGGSPGAPVRLRGHRTDRAGSEWRSWADFNLDAEGRLDLARAEPLAGTYRGRHAAGLFWSMRTEGPSPAREETLADQVADLRFEITLEVDGRAVDSREVLLRWAGPGVAREAVARDGVIASLWVPAGSPPFRPVLSFGGSDGAVHEETGALLASRGFLTMALPYFRYPGLPPELVDIPLEYFERALNLLLDDPRAARPGGVGVVGRSRGGELALLLGATFPTVDAVVAYVPSGIVHSGITSGGPSWQSDVPSWTRAGAPVPYLGHVPQGAPASELPPPVRLTPLYCADLADWGSAQAAAIPLERSAARLLLISGMDDAMWPSSLFSELAMARLHAFGYPRPHRHLAFPEAGHRFNFPNLPATTTASIHPADGQMYEYGGTPEGNTRAGLEAHRAALAWLRGE